MSDSRGIGTRSAAALVAANMIGAGVFTTSGFSLADLGQPRLVLLAWMLGGVIALCGALSYAGLASQIPGNGGEYLFLSRAMHPLVGFLAGWVSLLAGFTAPIAVAAHGLEAYLDASFGGIVSGGLPSGVIGASAIVAAGLFHAWGRGPGLRIQDAAVVLKLAAILGFIVIGAVILFKRGTPDALASGDGLANAGLSESLAASLPEPTLSAFAVTLVWISFAYSGWNAAVYVAGELDDPPRTLPRALIFGTLGVTGLYLALNAVFLFAAPVAALAGKAEVGAIAAEALGGPRLRDALSAVVALGLFTSISAMVMVGPRVYAQMAADGLFPQSLATGDESPRSAIALQVSLALVAFFMSGLRDLLLYVGFLLGLSAAATVACLFAPSIRQNLTRAVLPGYPWVPLAFIAATLGSAFFMLFREPVQAAAGMATVVVGAGVYWLNVRRVRPSETPHAESSHDETTP